MLFTWPGLANSSSQTLQQQSRSSLSVTLVPHDSRHSCVKIPFRSLLFKNNSVREVGLRLENLCQLRPKSTRGTCSLGGGVGVGFKADIDSAVTYSKYISLTILRQGSWKNNYFKVYFSFK